MTASSHTTSSEPERWDRLLILLNGGVLLILCLGGNSTPFGMLAGAFLFVVLLGGSSLIQALAMAATGRLHVPFALRALLFTLPAWALAVALVIGSRLPQPDNHRSPNTSPSGRYVLTMPIEGGLWRLTIRDQESGVIYRDDSEFIGQLNVYWIWDWEDRAWLYNSDTSQVYFWEPRNGLWQRTDWGHGRTRKVKRGIQPPEALYPERFRRK